MTTAPDDLGHRHGGRSRTATGATAPPEMRGPIGVVAPSWRRALPLVVATCDLAGGIVAALVALRLRFGSDTPDFFIAEGTVSYTSAVLAIAITWPGVLAAFGGYRTTVLGGGTDELGRVVEAGVTMFAALATMHLLLHTNLSGRVVALVVSFLVLATLVVRLVTGSMVRRARLQNRWRHRAVVYGSTAEAAALARHLRRPALAVDVVGTCVVDETDAAGSAPFDTPMGWSPVPDDAGAARSASTPVPRPAEPAHGVTITAPSRPTGRASGVGDVAIEAMARTGADLLAVAGGTKPSVVRSLAWALEGTGAELMIAPSVPDLAQQRVVVESVGGVVLLRVEECRQRRGWLLAKSLIDRLVAAVLLAVLAPVLGVIALLVRRSSPGPVLFRQRRVGQHGRTFEFLKFRTMVPDADSLLADLAGDNESDGLLFKLHDDPRVTDVGRVLRRLSLDELPQLWNVLRGDMSLVGPRPLPVGSDVYVGDERRRLRVRPGMTGLWQVSGRSDLPWEETVALDMYYVDHWSLGLDLAILARTPLAVVSGRGAY